MSDRPPGRPCAVWISHEATPEQVGYVMGHLCQNSSPECFWLGFCAHDNECFRTEAAAVREAKAAIRRAAASESPDVRDIMLGAAARIDISG